MRAEQLAKEHWEFVEGALLACEVRTYDAEKIGYCFKPAFIHGYKHALEDIEKEDWTYGGTALVSVREEQPRDSKGRFVKQ